MKVGTKVPVRQDIKSTAGHLAGDLTSPHPEADTVGVAHHGDETHQGLDTKTPGRGRASEPSLDRARSPGRVLGQGRTRWTGLPRIVTCQVVVSLAALMLYSIRHQPSSVVMSPGGLRPTDP